MRHWLALGGVGAEADLDTASAVMRSGVRCGESATSPGPGGNVTDSATPSPRVHTVTSALRSLPYPPPGSLDSESLPLSPFGACAPSPFLGHRLRAYPTYAHYLAAFNVNLSGRLQRKSVWPPLT